MDGQLSAIELQNIRQLYETRYEKFGSDHRTVGWGSVEDQILRFEVLCRGLDLEGKTILDIGCGLGDIVHFLNARYPGGFEYTGVDLAPSLIKEAKSEFNQAGVRFICADMYDLDDSEPYDVVLLSGALSYRVTDNEEYAKAILSKLFNLSTEAVSVNFLSDYVDYQTEKNFHFSPEKMLSFAKTLTKWVALYSDYPLWEFTLQLRHLPVEVAQDKI